MTDLRIWKELSVRLLCDNISTEELAKSRLASMIYDIIEKRRLTQVEAARILGIDQPKVSSLKNGRLGGFSYERLFSFLRKLDRDTEIVNNP